MKRKSPKKKAKIVINNHLKGDFGAMNPKTNKVEINIKAHKGDKAELASTIKHELMHVKHPKMTEKTVYKKTAKTKIPEGEQHKLLAKLRHKKLNYKMGAMKRKYKLGRGSQEPGTFIKLAQAKKAVSPVKPVGSIRKISMAGLV